MSASAQPKAAARPTPLIAQFDRYIASRLAGTFFTFLSIILALMMIEQFPRLFDIVSHAGDKAFLLGTAMLALVPEYAGIGSLFGLYFALALTIRRLSLRGELGAIEAIGVSPARWMRWPFGAALAVSLFVVAVQGWLMPMGEAAISAIRHDMTEGLFGLSLDEGEFIDLGEGAVLRFESVDALHGTMRGLFLKLHDKTITARTGRARSMPDGSVSITFEDGQLVTHARDGAARLTDFERLREAGIDLGDGAGAAKTEEEALKAATLGQLLVSLQPRAFAVAGSRLLWPLFALLAPLIALVLGKPPPRSEGFGGVMFGGVVLILFLRLAAFVGAANSAFPALVALGAGAASTLCVLLLFVAERKLGRGFVDAYAGRLLRAGRKLVGRQGMPALPRGQADQQVRQGLDFSTAYPASQA